MACSISSSGAFKFAFGGIVWSDGASGIFSLDFIVNIIILMYLVLSASFTMYVIYTNGHKMLTSLLALAIKD